tara:strand:- start:334 stop:903 length:570 start_codon:yes stop_codon:yes gene_type:complete
MEKYDKVAILCYLKKDNQLLFLLNKDNLVFNQNKTNKYTYFEGLRNENEFKPQNTAIRIFYENTFNSFYSLTEIEQYFNEITPFYNQKYHLYLYCININIQNEKIKLYNKIKSYIKCTFELKNGIVKDTLIFGKIPNNIPELNFEEDLKWYSISDILDRKNTDIFKREFFSCLIMLLRDTDFVFDQTIV